MEKEMTWRRAMLSELIGQLDYSMEFHYTLSCSTDGGKLTIVVDNAYRFWDKACDIAIEASKPYRDRVHIDFHSLEASVVITLAS